MSTSSTNIRAVCWSLLQRQDADDPAVRAVVFEPHPPVDLREDGVVFSQAGVPARPESPSPLTHDDCATGDDIAVVRLDAQPLRVRVAAVARTALSFFMSHALIPSLKK